jgi:hypothetical protein
MKMIFETHQLLMVFCKDEKETDIIYLHQYYYYQLILKNK